MFTFVKEITTKNIMKQNLINQLKVLQDIHSCYNYFLASSYSMDMPDTVQDIMSNRKVIFLEIQSLKALISAMPIITLDNEINALDSLETTNKGAMEFYSDKRFKLTE